MERRVLVPVDTSSASHRAVDWAVSNLVTPKTELHFLYVDSTGGKEHQGYPGTMEAHETTFTVGRERIVCCTTSPSSIPDNQGVVDTILDYANVHNINMMVLGNRGMGSVASKALKMVGLGSVSHRVLEHSPIPVAIVNQDWVLGRHHPSGDSSSSQAATSRKIAVAVDDTVDGQKAAQWALDEGLVTRSDQLWLVAVVPRDNIKVQAGQPECLQQAAQRARVHQMPADQIRLLPVTPSVGSIEDVASALADFVKEHSIELLILPSCSHREDLQGPEEKLSDKKATAVLDLGSHVHHCVHSCPCVVVAHR